MCEQRGLEPFHRPSAFPLSACRSTQAMTSTSRSLWMDFEHEGEDCHAVPPRFRSRPFPLAKFWRLAQRRAILLERDWRKPHCPSQIPGASGVPFGIFRRPEWDVPGWGKYGHNKLRWNCLTANTSARLPGEKTRRDRRDGRGWAAMVVRPGLSRLAVGADVVWRLGHAILSFLPDPRACRNEMDASKESCCFSVVFPRGARPIGSVPVPPSSLYTNARHRTYKRDAALASATLTGVGAFRSSFEFATCTCTCTPRPTAPTFYLRIGRQIKLRSPPSHRVAEAQHPTASLKPSCNTRLSAAPHRRSNVDANGQNNHPHSWSSVERPRRRSV
ncbi:hypothetical protein K456DRAFT_1299055 [Colletotrichum gloeosporioides 23]|nr:hypothetical protein K456DRAFT_1299055 [Colletotrichum gloeosporioides 23]